MAVLSNLICGSSVILIIHTLCLTIKPTTKPLEEAQSSGRKTRLINRPGDRATTNYGKRSDYLPFTRDDMC